MKKNKFIYLIDKSNDDGRLDLIDTFLESKWEKEVVTPQPKRELKIIAETFVSSSDSTILYKTKKIEREDGSFLYTCDCPGHWRTKDKRCKHIKELEKRN